MAGTYRGSPNVIYEICNEPNGNNVIWKDIKALWRLHHPGYSRH